MVSTERLHQVDDDFLLPEVERDMTNRSVVRVPRGKLIALLPRYKFLPFAVVLEDDGVFLFLGDCPGDELLLVGHFAVDAEPLGLGFRLLFGFLRLFVVFLGHLLPRISCHRLLA